MTSEQEDKIRLLPNETEELLLEEIDALRAESNHLKTWLADLLAKPIRSVSAPLCYCGSPGEECGFASNAVCTTIVCERHKHSHPKGFQGFAAY